MRMQVHGETQETALSIVQTPVAGKCSADSSGAPNISHIRESSGERRERQRKRDDTANARRPVQCLRSGSVYEALPR